MKQIIVTSIAALFFSLGGNARAAEDSNPGIDMSGRCFYGSKSFALESPILIGDATYVCGGDMLTPKWIKADKPVSVNCLYDDSYFAPGSQVSVSNAKSVIVCKSNGTWEQFSSQ